MKTLKLFIVLFLLSGSLVPVQLNAQEKSREIKKEFQVAQGNRLDIGNKFGDIDILNWEKPEVSITVKLAAAARNDAAAEDLLNTISVEISKIGEVVSAMTKIKNESGMSGNNKFEVNYTVYAPVWMNLNLENKFGNIHINEISGHIKIDLKHGELRAMKILRNSTPANEIILAYSSCTIEDAGNLDVNLSFSKLEIEKSGDVEAQTKYSGIRINSCSYFDANSKYDNFRFDRINNFSGDIMYSNLHVGELAGKFVLESTFSGLKIEQVLSSFESIRIENEKGACKIGIKPETVFDLNATAQRGDISISGFNVLEKKSEGTTKSVHAANGKSGKPINISVTDGAVSVYKN